MSVLLRPIGTGELALRVAAHRGRGDFSALVVNTASGDDSERAAGELVTEMESLGGLAVARIRAASDVPALASDLGQAAGPALITGLDDWSDVNWQHLDEIRSRLQREERTVLVLSRQAFDRLTRSAPNLGSWLASAWAYLPDADRITAEERERRLVALRAWSGLTDEEMLDRRRRGLLSSDPEYSLWLILLERGDLLAGGRP